MSNIRLTVTPNVRNTLDFLKSRFSLLKDDEILRLAISEMYHKYSSADNSINNVFKLLDQNSSGLNLEDAEYKKWWNAQKNA
jgi:hypothetical protein